MYWLKSRWNSGWRILPVAGLVAPSFGGSAAESIYAVRMATQVPVAARGGYGP
jgi:hypothetical protein